MAEQFIDTIAEHITGAIQQEISEDLFDQWSNKNLDEGSDYAEHMFMQYASDELKQQYNEYYGYIEGDEFLL
jgi:GGDEF domain-containing protein